MSPLATSDGVVSRPRVAEALASGSRQGVCLLVAPAGSGKSVALSQYLASSDDAHVRYDVRPEHGNLYGFVRGFADALTGINPAIREGLAEAFRGPEQSAVDLAAWIAEQMRSYRGLVAIDDLHLAEADASTAGFVTELVIRSAPGVRYILAARFTRHLPIARWIADGIAASPLTERELRFNESEAREAASLIQSCLSGSEVDQLLALTAGWPTAFTLALRLSERSSDLFDVAASTRLLSYEYLSEHVYRGLSDAQRRILLFGCMLPDFNAPVLERAGFDGARATLHELYGRVAFLTPVRTALEEVLPSTYRCHDLFRDFLERELHALGNAELRSVLVRGARALHESGDAVAALGLAVKARAADEIVDILRNDGFALLDRAHTDTVQKAIGALDGSRAGDAIVLGLRAQMEANGGHLVEAKLLFRQAIATCPDAVLKATLQLNYAIALCSVNDRACLDVLETAAEPELPAETRGPVLATLVFYYAYFGDYEKVRAELLDEIERLAWVLPSDVERAKILQRVGAATFLTGDFTRSRRVLERSAELALKCNLFRLAHSAYSTLCAVTLIGDEDVPRAASYARSDAECAERSSEAVRIRGSLLQQVDVTIREGGRDALRRLVDAFEQFSTPKDARIEPMVALAQGVLAAWDGEIGRAGTLVAAVCDQLWLQEERLLFRAFAAVLHAAGGDSEATKVAIAAVEIDARKPDSLRPSLARHQQRARLLCALAQAIGGRFSAARRLLHGVSDNGSALTSALERAVVSIVEEVHDGIASDGTRISLDALREIHYGGYADVLEAVAAAVRRRTTDAPLTAAEVAVLSALALGRRPKEIAADTGRSVNTVRTLIARVIDKLGCSGREQAVRIARSRGII